MKNAYPELPIIEFKKTKVSMANVISHLDSMKIPVEVKRACYIVFRNESANGTKGVNNNYIGFQADGGRWDSKYTERFAGTVVKTENQTGKTRIFIAFTSWTDSIEILADKLFDRGLFIGGTTHRITNVHIKTVRSLALNYYREWVSGKRTYIPSEEHIKNFTSMYNQAKVIFRE